MAGHLRIAGRITALAGCLANALSWGWILRAALFDFGPESNLGLVAIASLMIVLSIAGVYATLAEARGVMGLLLILWFVPYGFYLTASGVWYVGVSNLLFLLGAILLHLGSVLEPRGLGAE